MIFFRPQNKNNPLDHDIYRRFNDQYRLIGPDYDSKEITLVITPYSQRSKFPEGIIGDRCYCRAPTIHFYYNQLPVKEDGTKALVHHTLEFYFGSGVFPVEQDMIENIYSRSGYIYLSGAEHIEMDYSLQAERLEIAWDVVVDPSRLYDICLQLISLEIAFFARPW